MRKNRFFAFLFFSLLFAWRIISFPVVSASSDYHPPGDSQLQTVSGMSAATSLDIGRKDFISIIAAGATQPTVLFDHAAHEKNARSCSVCHHKSMKKCVDCHSLTGKNEGAGFNLANSMHELNSPHSCIGCHNRIKQTALCSICHSAMPARPTDSTCAVCHSGKNAPTARELLNPDSLIPKEMPDKFTIKSMAGDLAPVQFHHRSTVSILNRMIEENSLAVVFHGDKPVICNFCHHKDKGSDLKRSCSTCHPEKKNPQKPAIPALADVFHSRCLLCHKALNVSSPENCSFCHKDIQR